jgi:hypothetical protein
MDRARGNHTGPVRRAASTAGVRRRSRDHSAPLDYS